MSVTPPSPPEIEEPDSASENAARFLPWDTSSDSPSPVDQATGVWQNRGFRLGLAALALATLGEALLFSDEWRGLGVVVLLLAAVIGILAWSGTRSPILQYQSASAGNAWKLNVWWRGLGLRLLGITGAITLSIGSIAAYLADPGAVFGVQGVLWLAGMGLFILSCIRWYPGGNDGAVPRALPAWTPSEVLVFAGIIALSLVTHLAFLDQLPWRLHFDEGYAYIEVMRFYHGPAISHFTTTWVDTGLPSLWFGVEGLLMHITGPNLTGVRLGVALAGALTVIPVYGLARLLGGEGQKARMAALIAGFVVAVSAVYIHYSRISIINVTTPLAWASCFYFLLKGLRTRRPVDFAWAGLAAGLSMYTYYGTRLLPYLLLVFFAYLQVFHFNFKAVRERLGHFALVGAGFLVGFGPLLGFFIRNPQVWAGRGLDNLNVPAVIPTTWDALSADWNVLAPLAWRNFLGLSVIPGSDNVYYAPFMLPMEAALLVLGVGMLMWRWRQPDAFLVLLWGFGVMFTGGTLLDATTIPSFAHWTPAFPTFYLALALPVAALWDALLKQPRRSLRRAGTLLLALFLVSDLGMNAYAYLVQYPPRVPGDHSLEAAQGRFVENIEPNTDILVAGWGWVPLDVPIGEMMASPGSTVSKLLDPDHELPVVSRPGRNLAFLLYNDMYNYMPILEGYYPGGRPGEVRSPDGTLIAESYFVPAQIASIRH